MKAVVSIEHPAWAHQFRGMISELSRRGEDTFKELFYLHPSVFTPDPGVLERLGLNPDGYVFVRFIASLLDEYHWELNPESNST